MHLSGRQEAEQSTVSSQSDGQRQMPASARLELPALGGVCVWPMAATRSVNYHCCPPVCDTDASAAAVTLASCH